MLGRVYLDRLSLSQVMQFIKHEDIMEAMTTYVKEDLIKNKR